jgi:hypothetical protein
MKVGVVSDSHGEVENLKKAAEMLVEDHKVRVIVHLGDNFDDPEVLKHLDVRIVKVPGVFSAYYQDNNILNRKVESFHDKKVLITHTESSHENDLPGDIKPEEITKEKKVDVVLYGHTHIPAVDEKQGILYINPGHLKTEDKKGFPPTFAVVDFADRISIDIFNLSGELIKHEVFISATRS